MSAFARSVCFATLCLGAAQPALAQIQIRGQVEAGQVSTCYYCPTVTSFVLHGSETPISSNTVNLSALVGQHVLLSGTWGGTPALPIFQVASAQVVTSDFSINGNSSIGNTVRFITNAATGDIVANVMAMNAGVMTLTSDATLLLNVNQAAVLDAGVVTTSQFRTDLAIPNVPSLIGMHFFGQGVVFPGGGGAFFTTEPDAKRVQ